jgi:carboxylesterase type B
MPATPIGQRARTRLGLVRHGVVVVTINYRLGALGFLAETALASRPGAPSGNYGLMDQQAALRWVQRNIRGFGGNPKSVTLFGESAGGLSTLAQLISPGARGLFQRAIVESGTYDLTQQSLAAAESAGQAFAAKAGCARPVSSRDMAACLRRLPVSTILGNQDPVGYTPDIDGAVLTRTVKTALARGQFSRVPVMIGTNHDEYRLFIAIIQFLGGRVTAANYQAMIASTLNLPATAASAAAAQYPLGRYPSPPVALGAVATDAVFACHALTAEESMARYVPVYAYEFNDENAPELFLPPAGFPYGAAHASELQYLFRARRAWSCAARSAGGSRPTGRSARRTSAATATTPRTPTPAWSTSGCSASPGRASARRAPCTPPSPGAGGRRRLRHRPGRARRVPGRGRAGRGAGAGPGQGRPAGRRPARLRGRSGRRHVTGRCARGRRGGRRVVRRPGRAGQLRGDLRLLPRPGRPRRRRARRRLRRDVRRQREEPAGHRPCRAARAAPGRRLGGADRVHVGLLPGPRRRAVRRVEVRRPRLRGRAGARAGPGGPGQRRRPGRHAGHRADRPAQPRPGRPGPRRDRRPRAGPAPPHAAAGRAGRRGPRGQLRVPGLGPRPRDHRHGGPLRRRHRRQIRSQEEA